MNADLSGKTAVVTGGSRGIGKEIAATLVRRGAEVMVVSRRAESCRAAADEIGGSTRWFAAHVGDGEAASACVEAAMDAWGRVDILVNNAGINPYVGSTLDIDIGLWEKLLQINLTAPLRLSQLVWERSMKGRDGCSIVNLASTAGLTTGPLGPYGVSKAALLHLTAQLAAELGPAVRVNAVAPGVVRTEFARPIWDGPSADRLAGRYPTQRFGETTDVSEAVAFLASDLASWITGQTLVVDGGGLVSIA